MCDMDCLDSLIGRYPALECCREDIAAAFDALKVSYSGGGKLLVAGNGGSASDAEHIVGELMKSFVRPRPLSAEFKAALADPVLADGLQAGLPAIALTSHPALSTAFLNDCDPLLCFAQQLSVLGAPGDVFLGITTSGNSRNVLYAARTARAKGMKVIGLTGKTGGALAQLADICIRVPETETYKIQEYHLPVYHALCMMLEEYFF